jgi:hypothetical protein
MNKRIEEFIKEATVWEGMENGYIFDKEKFAKLIVQECIDILPEKVQIDDLYDGRILVQCGMAIKEHFGVEE